MKKIFTFLLTSIIIVSCFYKVNGQESESSKSDLSFSVDLVNRYIWRGLLFCPTPSIQPYLAYTSANENFSTGAWGSYSNSSNYGEVDLFLSYTYKYFTIAVWDYFVMDDTLARNSYFTYDKKTTGHSYEAMIVLGNFSLPLQLTSSVFFYGADLDENDDNYYSMYFEAAYTFKVANQDLNVFIGGTPNEGLYATGAGIVNLGFTLNRDVKITDSFTLPMKGSFVINPREENVYFIIGLTL